MLLVGGRALEIVQLAEHNNCMDAWCRLCTEFEPRTRGRITALLVEILTAKLHGPAEPALDSWDKLVKRYQDAPAVKSLMTASGWALSWQS